MLADDLAHAQLCGFWGGLWSCGSKSGIAYVERSEDHGATKATLLDGSAACVVSYEAMSETPGLWRAEDSGLYAALTIEDSVRVYRSLQGGTNFVHLQTVE